MEHFAHLSAYELNRARLLYWRDFASDYASLIAVALGGITLSLASYCPLF
jgi:hypothetical protein